MAGRIALIAVLGAVLARTGSAAVVFQSAGDMSYLTQLDGNNQEFGDDVTIDPTDPHFLTNIGISFQYLNDPAGGSPTTYAPELTLRLFEDDAGQPGALIATTSVTGPDFNINQLRVIDFPLNNVLIPDTFHFLVRQDNGPAGTNGFSIMLDSGESTIGVSSGNVTFASPEGDTPASGDAGLPLDVTATITATNVPEPTAAASLIAFLSAPLVARSRSRR